MRHIYICALKKDRKPILEFMQRKGVIEINEMVPEDAVFHRVDVYAAKYALEKNIVSAKDAIQILDTFVMVKKPMLAMLNGRKEVLTDVYNKFYQKHDNILHIANRICAIKKQIEDNKAEILKLQAQYEILMPWTTLDISMDFSGTRHTACFIGTLPDVWTQDMICGKLEAHMPLSADIISTSREQTCIFVLCVREKAEEVSETLRGMGFVHPAFTSAKAPAEQRQDLELQIAGSEAAITRLKEEIERYAAFREELQFLQDFDTMRAEKYEVICHIMQSSNVFIITGYIPEKEMPSVEDELCRRFEIGIDFEQPDLKEDVPVLLKNDGFSGPLERTVESFSLPGKGEADPTKIMSLFYYMLFGLMLSDAAYGAIITLACGIGLLRYRNTLEDNMKSTLKMYLYCGIATIFWGIMFGSYFGDIVDVVSETFFGHKVTIPPLWFFPVNEPMRMLVFSMLIGVIHLFSGLGMRMYQCIRKKDYKAVVYDTILWYVLLTSCILMLLSMKMFMDIVGLDFVLSGTVSNIAGILAAAAAVGIILTNGRESRNPFKRFLKGLYALYGITGYLSDVLSYSRLLALGLATGVICTVINKMAGMTASIGVLGVIPFTIIFLAGHTLNIGINALGAYVHTTRLQYVEFFGKFYSGGGRKFMPFSVKTKYFKFREE